MGDTERNLQYSTASQRRRKGFPTSSVAVHLVRRFWTRKMFNVRISNLTARSLYLPSSPGEMWIENAWSWIFMVHRVQTLLHAGTDFLKFSGNVPS